MISQQRIKEVLKYDLLTGDFHWRVSLCNNKVKVGDKAGCLSSDEKSIQVSIDGFTIKAHRLAFLYMEGYSPENDIDHINRNSLDNSWDNLREVSRLCNIRNRGRFKNNTSGVTGISWCKRSQKWRVTLGYLGSILRSGSYKHLKDAAGWDG